MLHALGLLRQLLRNPVAGKAPHFVSFTGPACHFRVRALHQFEIVFVCHGRLLLVNTGDSLLQETDVALSDLSYVIEFFFTPGYYPLTFPTA